MAARYKRIDDIVFSNLEPKSTNCLWLRHTKGYYELLIFNNGRWQNILNNSNIQNNDENP